MRKPIALTWDEYERLTPHGSYVENVKSYCRVRPELFTRNGHEKRTVCMCMGHTCFVSCNTCEFSHLLASADAFRAHLNDAWQCECKDSPNYKRLLKYRSKATLCSCFVPERRYD